MHPHCIIEGRRDPVPSAASWATGEAALGLCAVQQGEFKCDISDLLAL
jgi:hypothetical protein